MQIADLYGKSSDLRTQMQAIWFRVVEMDKFISEKSDSNQNFG
jgi:hypothetical protein